MVRGTILSIILLFSFSVGTAQADKKDIEELEKEGYYYFYELNDFSTSKNIFERVLMYDSLHYYANFILGWCEYELDYYESSIKYFNKALKIDSLNENSEFIYSIRGMAKEQLGDYEAAISDQSQAIKLKEAEHYYGRRGKSFFSLKKYQEALLDLNKAIELGENTFEIYFDRAATYQNLKEYEKAIADYKHSLQFRDSFKSPDYQEANYRIGFFYYKFDYYEEAIPYFEKYIKYGNEKGNLIDATFRAGAAYYYTGKYKEAIDKFNATIKLKADLEEPYTYLGMCYMAIEDYENTKKYLDKALELNPSSAQATYNLGKLEYLTENPEKGAELFSKTEILAEQENSYFVFYFLSESYLMLDEKEKALNALSKAISINPYNKRILDTRILINRNFFPERQVEMLSDIDRLKDLFDNSEILAFYEAYKAVMLGEFNRLEEALIHIDKAIELHSYPEYYALKAYILLLNEISSSQKQNKDNLDPDTQNEIMNYVEKLVTFDHRKQDAYMLKVLVQIAYDQHKDACNTAEKAISLGAKINKDHLKYICKGKEPKDKNSQWEFFYELTPFDERFSIGIF